MNQRYASLFAAFGAVFLFILSLRLDPLVTSIPRSSLLGILAGIFNFLGNGLFLFAVVAVLYAIARYRSNKKLSGAAKEGALSIAVSSVLLHLLKAAFERPRMSHIHEPVISMLQHPSIFDFTGRFNSFPSGHTTVSFALAYALSRRYRPLGYILYPLAALVGLARVYSGSHYPSDVVAGAFLGIGTAYYIHRWLEGDDSWRRAVLYLFFVFISFFKLGSFLLFDVDEAVFSEATREMLSTGDFITPTYNLLPRYDKPILIYYLMSLSFKTFGITEFAARFHSAILGAALAVMTFLFVRRVKGPLHALWSSVALTTNLEFFVYTHSAVTDMTLTFFITASLYSAYLFIEEDRSMWIYLFWAASAFAVLTKGVVGVLFPLSILVLYAAATGEKRALKKVFAPGPLLLFFAIGAPWFIAESYVKGWEFFDAFIIKHHIKRYTDVISSHGGPVYYYVLILLAGFFPWVVFLPGAFYRASKELKRRASGPLVFSLIWFFFIFLFFSISKTKLPNYILPLFPAASIMTGSFIAELVKGREKGAPLYFHTLALLAGAIGAAVMVLPSMKIRMDVEFSPAFFYVLGTVFIVMGAAALLHRYSIVKGAWAVAGSTVLLIIFLRTYALPPVNLYLQKTLYDFSTFARKLKKDAALVAYEINKPSIAFYYRDPVPKLERKDLKTLKERVSKQGLLIITDRDRLGDLEGVAGLKVLYAQGEYVLLTNEKGLAYKPPAGS